MEQESDPPVAAPRQSLPQPQAPPRRSLEETNLNKFKKLHSEAYSATSTAMALDEQGQKEPAFKAYQEALEKIDKTVQWAHRGGFSPGEIDKVDELVYKMRMTRKEVLERVSDLQHTSTPSSGPASSSSYLDGPTSNPAEVLPGATGTPANSSGANLPPYSPGSFDTRSGGNLYGQLSGHLEEIALEQANLRNPLPMNAQEVFTIVDNIQIYFISPDDNVMAPSYPSFLRIVVLNADSPVSSPSTATQLQQPPAFLQVGDWTYPLVPGQSPVFHSNDGSYIFPDLVSVNEGANVGLILPPEISEEQRKSFENILLQLTGLPAFPIVPTDEELAEVPAAAATLPTGPKLKDDDAKAKDRGAIVVPPRPAPPAVVPEEVTPRIGTRIAEGLMSGAETVAQGLIVGAEKTSELLGRGTQYVIGKMHPAKEEPKISPQVKGYVKKAKMITGHTVQISGYLVTQLGRGTAHLGRKIAPYVQSSTARLYARTTKTSDVEASQKMGQVLEVSGGALVGIGTVYFGLEHAAKVLANSLANNTVSVVKHRYGHEAGCLADDTAATVGNTVMTGMNCHYLGPKAIAKRAVKDAGKASLQPQEPKVKPNSIGE